MIPLCETLHITVNDLLSGERVSESDYQKKAEDNMMDLIKENEENKKQMILSVICGTITIIAVCSLVIIASYMDLPTAVRILLIAGASLLRWRGLVLRPCWRSGQGTLNVRIARHCLCRRWESM